MIDLVLCASGADEVRIVHDLAQEARGRARVVRRCADLAETRGVVSAGIGDAVLVDLSVRGFDRDVAMDLLRAGAVVIGLRPEAGSVPRTDLGLRHVVSSGAPVAEILELVESALGEDETDAWTQEPDLEDVPVPSRILAVWGPMGSPGRSVLAANLAAEAASAGVPTVLVDADTYAPSLGQMLGVLEESPGLVAACRASARDTLDERTLESLIPRVGPGLRLMAGIGVPGRWAEVRGSGIEGVLSALRRRGGLIVVDCAAPLEEDEELSYDTEAPQRNAATLGTLAAADLVLAVVAAEPSNITRLIRERERIQELGIDPPRVVINRVTGAVPAARLSDLVSARMPLAGVHLLPEDSTACHRAAWDGALLSECAPKSPLRRAVRELSFSAEILGPLHGARSAAGT